MWIKKNELKREKKWVIIIKVKISRLDEEGVFFSVNFSLVIRVICLIDIHFYPVRELIAGSILF